MEAAGRKAREVAARQADTPHVRRHLMGGHDAHLAEVSEFPRIGTVAAPDERRTGVAEDVLEIVGDDALGDAMLPASRPSTTTVRTSRRKNATGCRSRRR